MASGGKKPSGDRPILFHLIHLPPEAGDPWGSDPSLVIHHGVFCSGPLCRGLDEPIKGIRYKCRVCPNCDFCDGCVRCPDNDHDQRHELFEFLGLSEIADPAKMSPDEIKDFHESSSGGPLEGIYLRGDQQEPGKMYGKITRNAVLQSIGSAGQCQEIEDEVNYDVWHHQDHVVDAMIGRVRKYTHPDLRLKGGKATTWLAHLRPGDGEQKLQCSFTVMQLHDAPSYETLSCFWSKARYERKRSRDGASCSGAQRSNVVYVDNKHFVAVSPTLSDALRGLRYIDTARTLWTPELCVQGENESERNFHIRATGLIYNCATTSIFWVGEEDEHTQAAFELIEQLCHKCDCPEDQLPSPQEMGSDPDLDLPPLSSDDWQSLLKFFPHQAFGHDWQFNDAAFAQKAIVACGTYATEWWKAEKVARLLRQPAWIDALLRIPLDMINLDL